MDNKVLLDPQPFEGAINPQQLVKQPIWRFHRKNPRTRVQEYMDVSEPKEFQDAKYRLHPINNGGTWYWSVVDTTAIKARRGVQFPDL